MLSSVIACTSKKENAAGDDWKALDSYHDVLAEVYHPFKDSGNVEPAKRLISSLAEKGDSLTLVSLPGKVDNDEMKTLVAKITTDTRTLAEEVKAGAADSVVASKLDPIHDQFHKIHAIWKRAGKGKDHEEHH